MAKIMLIDDIKKRALNDNVPIIQDEGIEFLIKFIKEHDIKRILEIGTAIGYSAIKMASINSDITVTTIERDEVRYKEAVKNVNECELNDRITLIYGDALEVDVDGNYDLIFIDAAKGKNIDFFEKYTSLLVKGGYVITDNLSFHGYVYMNENEISSRNIRGLVRKIKKYINYLKTNEKYDTTFYTFGDGVSVSKRK
ncbi:MAG: O-methyltransferase [bacterium]|nr:O-methyltransferase [bacterium]